MREAKPVVGLLLSSFAWQASLAAGQASDQAVFRNNIGGGQRPCGCGSNTHTDATHYGGSDRGGSYSYHWETNGGGGSGVESGGWDGTSQGDQGGSPGNGGSYWWHWESPGGGSGAKKYYTGFDPTATTPDSGTNNWASVAPGDDASDVDVAPGGGGSGKWDGSGPSGASGSGSGKWDGSGPSGAS
ncbi:hypothetical protein BDV25DRAFT_139499, partial [Aspergillus avenaceus]